MIIIARLRIAALTLGLSVLGACELADERYPDDWPELAATDSVRCAALTGVFKDQATLNQSQSLTLEGIPISLSGILLKKGWPFHIGEDAEYAEYVSFDKDNDRINLYNGGAVDTLPYKKWLRDNLVFDDGACIYEIYDTGFSAHMFGISKSKADIEFLKANKNNLVIRYADRTSGMLTFIYPMYVDVEMWALWEDVSNNEVHCKMPDDEISIRKAGACLSAEGIIVSFNQ